MKEERINIGWLTIPNQIVFDNKIRPLSKFVLGLILSFQYQSQCYASNDWFAEQFEVSIRTIESVIKELREHEYIHTVYYPRTKKRLITPANHTIWRAYSNIREGSHRVNTKPNGDKKEYQSRKSTINLAELNKGIKELVQI